MKQKHYKQNSMNITGFDKKEHEHDTESDVLLAPDEVTVDQQQIILYNDDFNTFEFVFRFNGREEK